MVKSVGQKNTSKGSKRKLKIVSTLVILCVIALIGILFALFYVGSTKEIVAVADQFKPDSSWKLVTDDVQPPKAFCGDVECPRVYRGWSTKNVISKDLFIEQLRSSGFNFPVVGDCLLRSNDFGAATTLCSASGNINGYGVIVNVGGSNTPGSANIGLTIVKEK